MLQVMVTSDGYMFILLGPKTAACLQLPTRRGYFLSLRQLAAAVCSQPKLTDWTRTAAVLKAVLLLLVVVVVVPPPPPPPPHRHRHRHHHHHHVDSDYYYCYYYFYL